MHLDILTWATPNARALETSPNQNRTDKNSHEFNPKIAIKSK